MLSDGVDQALGNVVAGDTRSWVPSGFTGSRAARAVAHEEVSSSVGPRAVRIEKWCQTGANGSAEKSLIRMAGGHEAAEGNSFLAGPLALIIDEEEGLVLLDGAAQRESKLVLVKFFSFRREIAASVQ